MIVEILEEVQGWAEAGHRFALAFVVETWGSSPRPVGAVLAYRDDGLTLGSVSGGCVESAVVDALRGCLESGEARSLRFEAIEQETLWSVGLSCGGAITLWLQPDPGRAPAWAEMVATVGRRESGFLLVGEEGLRWVIGEAPSDAGWAVPVAPKPRLIIIGAGHLGVALTTLAKGTGFEVVMIDPRRSLMVPERFPVSPDQMLMDYPQRALEALGLGASDALVTLSHDPKLDEPALECALLAGVGYVGALGSRKTQAERNDRLLEAGFSVEEIAQIHGPVGLSIGAKTTEEIAVSILAEIIHDRRCR